MLHQEVEMKVWIKVLWVPVAFMLLMAVCYHIADYELSLLEVMK